MDMKLVIFGVVLCAAAVCSQRKQIQVAPWVPPPDRKHCMAVHEGWEWLNVPAPPCSTPNSNSVCGYWNCRVWRVRRSKCMGCCGGSNHTVNSIPPWGVDKDCECCQIQPGGVRLVWPELICHKWTVWTQWWFILVEYDKPTGILMDDCAYIVVTDCDCQDCSGTEYFREGPPTDRVLEGEVVGRPAPPKSTEREKTVAFDEAKEEFEELRTATERRGATVVRNTDQEQ